MASEAKNELAVVVDDTEFMKWLEGEIHGWTEEYNQRQEKFYEENPEVPDCLALPMPKHYLNNDYGLQRTQGQPKE